MMRMFGRAIVVLLIYHGAAFCGVVIVSVGSQPPPTAETVAFAFGAAFLAAVITGVIEVLFKLWEWIVS